MDEINYLIAHIKDLARKSSKEGIMTSTSFLSLSEQSEINKVLPSLNKEYLNELKSFTKFKQRIFKWIKFYFRWRRDGK